MALKIGGTTVINDSRGLENISNIKTVNGQSIVGTGDITVSGGAVSADNVTETTSRVFISLSQKYDLFGISDPSTRYVSKQQLKTINGQAIHNDWGGDLTISGSPDFTSSKNITIGGKNFAGVMQGAVWVGFGGGQTITNPNTDPMMGGGGTIYTADESTAVGKHALFMNTTGNFNTAIGSNALSSNNNGAQNTAIGYESLVNNIAGSDNTAVGVWALSRNNSGNNNTAVGIRALRSNRTGANNVAIGTDALANNRVGGDNIAIGYSALNKTWASDIPTGEKNIAIGYKVMSGDLYGNANIAIGEQALSNCTGSNNITILNCADAMSVHYVAPVYSHVGTDSNKIAIGSSSVTNAYIQVAWTVVSDARDKTNFAAVPHGLEFVRQLKPTAYQFRTERGSEATNGGVRYGFKAQDIAAIEPEAVIVDTTNPEKLYYNESNLVPVLVNAIQELLTRIEILESKSQTK